MRRKFLALAAVAMLAGCSSQSSDGAIRIGFIGPLTGDVAGLGLDGLNGAMMAVDKINAAGGIGGKLVQLIAEDGRCAGADAAAAAQKLMNVDKVVAVIGGMCSGETLAAAAVAEATKVVILSPTSSSPDVTNAGEFVFRDYPSDALKTTAMAAYFREKGWSKVAMISENTDFSQGFRASLTSKLPAGGLVFDEVVEPGTKDFRTLLTRLKDMDFDVFIPNGNSDSVIGPMLQQLREAGFEQVAVAHDAADSVTMAKDLPEATEGLQVINVSSDVRDASFADAFKKEYGDPKYGISFAGYAYDAANVIFAAVAGGATDGEGIRTYLNAVQEYDGVVGAFSFDDNGDVEGIPYVLKQFKNGSIVTVGPIVME